MRAAEVACSVIFLIGCEGGHAPPPPEVTPTFTPAPTPGPVLLVLDTEGRGRIASDTPGIDCIGLCQLQVEAGRTVTFVATPDPGWTFTGWGEFCTGRAGCTISTGGMWMVTAHFRQIADTARITVAVAGSGRVVSDPPGIDCPGSCLMTIAGGETVSLVASARDGSTFAGFAGACSGNGRCSFVANVDTAVEAEFARDEAPAACAGIAPPSVPARGVFQRPMDQYVVECGEGIGDGQGRLAFPTLLNDPNAHGASTRFVPQPSGFLGWGDCGYLCRDSVLVIGSWDGPGNMGETTRLGASRNPAAHVVDAADPSGGMLLAGDFSSVVPPAGEGPFVRSAVMFERGPSGPAPRWGPKPLATKGALLAAGVDVLGRSLVISDGGPAFGAGTLSAEWLDRDGASVTGEFLLSSSGAPPDGTSLETAPLVGGGFVVMQVQGFHDPFFDSFSALRQPLLTIASAATGAQAPPAWMRSLPNTRLGIIQGGAGYALLPDGAMDVDCAERVGVVAPDGTFCGSADYRIAPGICDAADATLGLDGTVIVKLPGDMEHANPATSAHSCTWASWPAALR
ncbi:MAG: InlB B-repeat-containing protein [Myxococcales bacterium]